ncbi:MAG: phospholipid-binding protein [Acidobacteria bacterium]|nr:MAG: phospholipid-binding protein [Acidobacteriota bacterium]
MDSGANKILRMGLGVALFLGCAGAIFAQDANSGQAPDNTKTNAHQRANGEPSADQQKEDTSDRAITQQVRKAIVKDKALSTYAHNIKIITQNGQVTLAGPVRSEEEKKALEEKASAVAGVSNVKNQLQVAEKQ